MAKFLEGWVEEEVLSILQTPLSLPISPPPPSKLLNKKKIFYVLNIYSDQKILLVTDSKIRITILLPQLHEEHQEIFNNLTKNSFIILEDYYYATFLQSNQTEHHFSSLEHLGVGFPILMICSSFTTTKSGKIRRSKSPWTEINEVILFYSLLV